MLHYNGKLKTNAHLLRKNMTDSEHKLWSRIRGKQLLGLQFYRQKIIGNYIVDFYCHSAKTIIEIDGSQHYTLKGLNADKVRDEYMKNLGFHVIRYPSDEVILNTDIIIEDIYNHLISFTSTSAKSASPFAKGD
jgi:very-short-patch-repair endonuclease